MGVVSNKESKQIVMKNCIKVDDVPVKYQEITINSEKPDDMVFSDYFVNDEAKEVYKENRATIRQLEAAFEDKAFIEQESLTAEALEVK